MSNFSTRIPTNLTKRQRSIIDNIILPDMHESMVLEFACDDDGMPTHSGRGFVLFSVRPSSPSSGRGMACGVIGPRGGLRYTYYPIRGDKRKFSGRSALTAFAIYLG